MIKLINFYYSKSSCSYFFSKTCYFCFQERKIFLLKDIKGHKDDPTHKSLWGSVKI